MSVATSKLAYDDAFAAFDRALTDPLGIRIRMDTVDAATHFRMRCHQARKIDRAENSETYPKGDPLHGTSQYDRLVLRIRKDEGAWWLYFEKQEEIPGDVQSLSGNGLAKLPPPSRALPTTNLYALATILDVEHTEVKRIESPTAIRRRI